MNKIVTITVSSSFSASHWHDKMLDEAAHPHNFKYEVTLKGTVNAEGFLVDFRAVEATLKRINARLEGTMLNDLLKYPTTENLAFWLFDEIKKEYPQLTKINIREKENFSAAYEP